MTRAEEWRTKLDTIDRAIHEEMSLEVASRRQMLLRFLYSERKAYALALDQPSTVQRVEGPECVSAPPVRESRDARRRIHRIVTWGGIGDALLMTPSIRALKQRDPECRVYVYWVAEKHRDALLNNRYIDRLKRFDRWTKAAHGWLSRFNLLEIRPWSPRKPAANWFARRFGGREINRFDYSRLGPSLFYTKNAARIIGEMMGVDVVDSTPDCFLTPEEELEGRRMVSTYANPVVIHIRPASSPNKSWPTDRWEQLVCGNSGYDFLQIGSARDERVRGATDLRGASIRQTFAIIKAARRFIGVDSGFGHAAAALKTPAVILFGASTPVIWGHRENQNLYAPPRCSPCIDMLHNQPCPYGRECMSNIAVADVERALSASKHAAR